MWVTNHNEGHYVRKIRLSTVWWTVVTSFFASLFPYTTSLVDSHFNNSFAQGLYGIVVLLVSISKVMESRSLVLADPDNKTLAQSGLIANRGIWWDLTVKVLGFILSVTVFAPAMMISVLLTLIVFVIPAQVTMARQLN